MAPIDAVLPRLLAALEARAEAVLAAPPGAGKTTRVPPALLGADWTAGRKIVLLSPRRMAARAAAAFMARSRGEEVGETIGYRVRLDSRVGSKTRIEVVTEGVFTRRILGDPALEDVAAVIFDEFHERSLDADLGLALARDAQALRPDLKLLVMSATLDTARVAALLDNAPVIASEGRQFPVETSYRPRRPGARLEDDVAAACLAALAEAGSQLVFLPGMREIERTADLLRARVAADVDVRPLHGSLSPADQDAAIAPSPSGRRKIVLATSIAETSLTIEGVRVVIDSGLSRRPRYEPDVGLTRLETVRVSQAAAEQRRGRAGRLEPGLCIRLWEAGETRALPPHDRPEMFDADLSGLALDLAAWGVADPGALSWMDPPPRAAWAEAQKLLRAVGALDAEGRLTERGRAMARLPLPPRLANMAIGGGKSAAEIAVLLTEQGLGGRDVDIAERLWRWRSDRSPRANAARGLASRIARMAGEADDLTPGAALLRAYPDRAAKARGEGAFTMANGRAASLDLADPLARAPFLAVAEIAGRADSARILLAAETTREEIEAALPVETRIETSVDEAGRVRAQRVRRLGKIVLSSAPAELSAETIESALMEVVRREGLQALGWSEADVQLRARAALLRGLGFDFPDWSDETLMASLETWLQAALAGVAQIGDVEVGRALEAQLTYAQTRALAEKAPARFETPAGGSARIDYTAEAGPAVEVRLQEMFGVAAHPAVADGRAPLLLRLTSPAHRPIATTKDLPGFWRGAYADVRKDMRGRYPKHPWPEDPLSAAPTRKAKPRS